MRVWFGGITKNEQLFKSGLFRKITQKDVQELTFDRPFMTWIDYDTTLRRETIEETAEIIRKRRLTLLPVNGPCISGVKAKSV